MITSMDTKVDGVANVGLNKVEVQIEGQCDVVNAGFMFAIWSHKRGMFSTSMVI